MDEGGAVPETNEVTLSRDLTAKELRDMLQPCPWLFLPEYRSERLEQVLRCLTLKNDPLVSLFTAAPHLSLLQFAFDFVSN